MSFNAAAERVRDGSRTEWRRLSNLRGCVRSFCRLTGASYRATLADLGLVWEYGIPRPPPTGEFLLERLRELQRERNRYLERLRRFEMQRIRAKDRGRRVLSARDKAAFEAMRLSPVRDRTATG